MRSEREGAALAVVADSGLDAGFGHRRRLVGVSVLAALPGKHVSMIRRGDTRGLRRRRARVWIYAVLKHCLPTAKPSPHFAVSNGLDPYTAM